MSKSIRCYDYVNHPFDQVCDALRSKSNSVFHEATTSAESRAETVAAGLHVNIAGIEIGKDVAVRIKLYEEFENKTSKKMTVHLEWQATGQPGVFPVMTARLEVYPITSTETQLDFHGEYEPPLGVLGKAIDAVVGHRIAEASVHQFLTEVATYLRKNIPTMQNQ
jgi:hypothetical protein